MHLPPWALQAKFGSPRCAWGCPPCPGGWGWERRWVARRPSRGAEPGGCESSACSPNATVIICMWLLPCHPSPPPCAFFSTPTALRIKGLRARLGPLLGERAVAVLYLDPARIYINSLRLFGSIYSTAGSGKGSPQGFISYKQSSQTAER